MNIFDYFKTRFRKMFALSDIMCLPLECFFYPSFIIDKDIVE